MSGSLSRFLRQFRREVALRDAGEVTDRDLLQRFARGRDEDAFAALVKRHGPLVLGVCLRVLRDFTDAEDAFQATFLVLVRRASSIRQPERLGNWLYGVALRVAHKARADAARRRTHQQQLTDMPAREPDGEADWEDLCRVLDDEVQRLPDKFRVPLMLCYLQGMTREEAAAQLGWSAGAVKGMLERGRELLRSRLVRRGVVLSSGSLAAMLSENALSAVVPAVLSDRTVKAALVFAVGKAAASGVISTKVVMLTEGVVRTMLLSKLRSVMPVATLAILGAVALGYGVLVGGQPNGKSESAQKPTVRAEDKSKEVERDLTKATKAPAKANSDKPDLIKPGDYLWIQASGTLPGEPISGLYRVEPSGKVSLGPSYGRVQLKGLSLEEAEKATRRHLANMLKKFDVSVIRYEPLALGTLGANKTLTLERRVQELEEEVRLLQEAVKKLQKKRRD